MDVINSVTLHERLQEYIYVICWPGGPYCARGLEDGPRLQAEGRAQDQVNKTKQIRPSPANKT